MSLTLHTNYGDIKVELNCEDTPRTCPFLPHTDSSSSSPYAPTGWLAGWLADRLADRPTDWLTDRLTDWITYSLVHSPSSTLRQVVTFLGWLLRASTMIPSSTEI